MTAPAASPPSRPPHECCGLAILDWIELIFCQMLTVMVVCITYPLYVMSDRSTPNLKSDPGIISTTTLALILAVIYATLTSASNFKSIDHFPKVPAAAVSCIFLLFGMCDAWNAIRFQNRLADNKKKFGEHDDPNKRAEAAATFIFFDFLLSAVLFVLALAKSPRRAKSAYNHVPEDSGAAPGDQEAPPAVFGNEQGLAKQRPGKVTSG